MDALTARGSDDIGKDESQSKARIQQGPRGKLSLRFPITEWISL
jgi:hypothetical protein